MTVSKARLTTPSPAVAKAKKSRRPSAPRAGADNAREALRRSPAPPFDVVESKLHVPTLRSGTVSRTALVNRMRATQEPIALLTAPAGYGKTTVLAQWAVRDSRPFAWVSVDERDNDPIVLLRHLALALHRIEPLPRSVLETLAAPGPSVWRSAVPRLGSALAAFDQPIVLVLDDTHLLRAREGLDAVLTLSQHGPEGSLLVLAGRSAPKLPVAALRGRGQLSEIGVDRLALSPHEAQLLLRATGADLSLAAVEEIVDRCEGWPAALYLAALARREEDERIEDREQTIPFSGDNKHLADYLRSEYLSKLRPGALRFLRRTSMLEQMCGSLCDAVLDDQGSARELEKIERSNLFLVPLDQTREWHRYHHLFRDLLRRELAENEPQLLGLLHRRAADWYERHGDLESALEHGLAAGDLDRVAGILTDIALPAYYGGRIASVERWLSHFDDVALLERYPGVALQGSWVHAIGGRADDAQRWLRAAERGTFKGTLADGCTTLSPWIAVLRAALCREGVYQMIADAESGLAGLPRESLLRPTALLLLGSAHVLLGEDERADAFLAAAATEAERLGATDTQMVALSQRCLIASAHDDPAASHDLALQAQELVDHANVEEYVTSAIALAVAARAALRQGRWDQARAQLADAERVRPLLAAAIFPWLTIQAQIELARAYLALGDGKARTLMKEIRQQVQDHPHIGVLVDQAAALEIDVNAMPEHGNGSAVGLTGAELRLLPLLSTHLSFREIGEELFVSRNTIKTQAISVYRKLGVSSRSDAIDRAATLGLVDTGKRAV
jgi:LuxR family transcriptional regulator, maltose regulon positive regulatory protein